MRRVVIWLASTVTVLVLLFGYHTSTDKVVTSTGTTAASASPSPGSSTPTAAPTSSSPSSPSSPSSSSSPSSTSSSSSPSARSSSTTASAPASYTGSVAQTRWGPVQVKITVAGDTITGVDVLQQPSGNPRDVEINDRALPILIAETKAASSADIDMVSGATVTSDGYVESLQAALDKI